MRLWIRREVMEYIMMFSNSGALLQLSWRRTPMGVMVYDAECVEASAASHVGPAYPRSAEAIRVPATWSCARREREWRDWVRSVVEANEEGA